MNGSPCNIKIVGIGGAGCIIVKQMVSEDMHGVECVVINSDRQSLFVSGCPHKVQLGHINGIPERRDIELGRRYAQESRASIADALRGASAAILVAGQGGSVGSGATPVVAETARELGIVTLCLVTTPFSFEGKRRLEAAEQGLTALRSAASRILVFSHELVMASLNPKLHFGDAMDCANEELHEAIRFLVRRIHDQGFLNLSSEDMLRAVQDAGFKHFISMS